MHPQLSAVLEEFEGASTRLHRLVDHLPPGRWSERPEPGRWSVAECVAHLNLTGQAFLPELKGALAEAVGRGETFRGRYRRDPVGWLLSPFTGPLARIGSFRLGAVRTPAAFVPGGSLPRSEVMAEFDRLQEEQMEVVRAADGHPIHRVKIASPFEPRMRYSAYSALLILPRHQRRHTLQAEEAARGR